jgi:hypothetical protein
MYAAGGLLQDPLTGTLDAEADEDGDELRAVALADEDEDAWDTEDTECGIEPLMAELLEAKELCCDDGKEAVDDSLELELKIDIEDAFDDSMDVDETLL